MNDLRLILLGIGLLFIVGIYLWDIYKSRLHIRSKIEKISSEKNNYNGRIKIVREEEFDQDNQDALSEFKEFINHARRDGPDSEPLSLKDDKQDIKSTEAKQEQKPKDTENKLVVFYIMAEKNEPFTGPKILAATKEVGMIYGSMDIFHYYESGEIVSKKALFSLLNIVEPGLFDLKQMENFKTHGLALFMQTTSDKDNELVFDIMLDTAWKLVELLGGELHDEQHNVVDPLIVGTLRERLYF